ncbi:hypothetical protein EDB89DRAFT_1910634 [Lactarius sanguifluus]|nr:hypothetical protein EDB89DRAFT_1910634 [Lactarius sanguifluus]
MGTAPLPSPLGTPPPSGQPPLGALPPRDVFSPENLLGWYKYNGKVVDATNISLAPLSKKRRSPILPDLPLSLVLLLFGTCVVHRRSTVLVRRREPMGDQYPILSKGPGNLLIQTEGHPTGVTARSEAPNLWDPCLPDLLCWQYLAHIFSQETPSIISGPTSPCTLWPQSVNGSTAGIAVLSQSQIPEKTPPTFAPRFFDGSLGNQAIGEVIPNCHTHTRHDQVGNLCLLKYKRGRYDSPDQEATFNYISPIMQTHLPVTCAIVKYHNNSGKDSRRSDKTRSWEAHGTLRIVAKLPGATVPIAARMSPRPEIDPELVLRESRRGLSATSAPEEPDLFARRQKRWHRPRGQAHASGARRAEGLCARGSKARLRSHGCSTRAAPTSTSIPSPMATVITDNVILSVDPEQKGLTGRQDSRAVAEAIGLSYINTARSPVEELKANGQPGEVPLFQQRVVVPAIIHYLPDPNDCAIIQKDQVYLCDSGGQYLDGTTDVTRTLHFGTPTDEQRRAFTRVLQGYIAIYAVIPVSSWMAGTLTRLSLERSRRHMGEELLLAGRSSANLFSTEDNSKGTDYRHGTGHGVGHFLTLNVRKAYNSLCTPLKSGMTVSNGTGFPLSYAQIHRNTERAEPGYHADGECGIRIENVVNVREAQTPNNFGDKGIPSFEHVTMVWFFSPCLLASPVSGRRTDMDVMVGVTLFMCHSCPPTSAVV